MSGAARSEMIIAHENVARHSKVSRKRFERVLFYFPDTCRSSLSKTCKENKKPCISKKSTNTATKRPTKVSKARPGHRNHQVYTFYRLLPRVAFRQRLRGPLGKGEKGESKAPRKKFRTINSKRVSSLDL